MSTAKPELCTGLALRFKRASSLLPKKQSVPEVCPNNALCVCVHTHMSVHTATPVCVPESTNA